MNQPSPDKPSPILMLAPLAFVLIGYQYVFNASQSHQLSTLQRQAQSLAVQERGVHAEERKLHSDLRAKRQEMTGLNTERTQADAEQEQLKERREVMRGPVLVGDQAGASSTRPAGTIQAVFSLLQTHDLLLHESSTPQKKKEGASDREQRELSQLLEVPPTGSAVYRLTVQGRFADLQAALHTLRREQPTVRLIAISLEPATPSETQRTWVLDLAVG